MITTGDAIATGKTVTAQISKNGAAFANSTNSVTELSNGFYYLQLTASELNADLVMVKLTATGCAQQNLVFYTETAVDLSAVALEATLDAHDTAIKALVEALKVRVDDLEVFVLGGI